MKVYKKLIQFLNKTQRWQGGYLLGLMLIGMFLETFGISLVIPAIKLMTETDIAEKYPEIKPWLIIFGNPNQRQLVIWGMLSLVCVYTVKTIFLSYLSWRQAKFVFGLQSEISQRLFSGYLRQPYTFHLQRNSAQLIRNIMTEVSQLTMCAILPCVMLISEGLVVSGIIILLLAIEPLGSLAVIVTVSLVGFLFYHVTRNRILQWGKARQLHEGKRIQHLQQGLGGVKEVMLFGREEEFIKQYRLHNIGAARVTQKQTVIQALPRFGLEWMAITGLSVLVLTMVLRGCLLETLLPVIGLFAAAAFRLLPSTSRVLNSLQHLRYSSPAINNLYSEINLIKDRFIQKSDCSDIHNELQKEIVLKNVVYQYPNTERLVLKNVNLNILKGSSVGFIGGSGAGKTTLIDIILGLLKPVQGIVAIDGKDIGQNLRLWQNQIGYVPQNIYLTDDTLRRNIAFGLQDNQIDEVALQRAIEAAQLKDFIKSLPEGLQTMVGERGVRLSGGQRQRIGIARALYHNPSVLVLDEATSSLDMTTEAGVMESVNALHGQKTIIIVAHRLSTVAYCDKLFKFEDGCMVKTGTYDEVVNG